MIDSAPCPLCGATTDRVLSRELRRGEGVVLYCHGCDLGFLVQDKPFDAVAHYSGPYREAASHHAEGGATNPQEIFETYSPYQTERLRLIASHLRPESSVLEIGASAGQFLAHLEGRCARRCAIEPDPECCALMRAKGIEAEASFLRDSRFFSDKFDLVCAYQTLEHVEDPVAFLSDLKAVMARGAVALVEFPNLHDALLSIWGVEEFRRFYFHADHRFYLSSGSAQAIAKLAGFAEPKVIFSQDYNLLGTLNWLVNRIPLATCHPGLSRINLEGNDPALSRWLSSALNHLSDEYADRLAKAGTSSNITLVLT